MDQLFSDAVLNTKSISDNGNASSSYFSAMGILGVDSLVSKWIGYILDVDLFKGKARSLFLVRYLLHYLKEYGVVNISSFIETGEMIQEWVKSSDVKDTETNLFLNVNKHFHLINDYWSRIEESSNLMKITSSELLFNVLKASTIVDEKVKKRCGMFLNFCIYLEQREYDILQRNIDNFLNVSNSSWLKYYDFGDEELDKEVMDILSKIDKSENILITFLVGGSSYNLSPWIMVCAFLKYIELLGKSTRDMYTHIKNFIGRERPIAYLVTSEKRFQEIAFQCCVLKCLMPDVVTYETRCKTKDKNTMIVLYSLPQIMKWGCSVDKFSFIDENMEQQIHKFIYFLKREGVHLLEEHPTLHAMVMSPETEGRNTINSIMKHMIDDTFKNVKASVYGEFLRPHEVVKITIPLFISLFLEKEFLDFNEKQAGGHTITKTFLYSLFPLLWSVAFDTQSRIVHML